MKSEERREKGGKRGGKRKALGGLQSKKEERYRKDANSKGAIEEKVGLEIRQRVDALALSSALRGVQNARDYKRISDWNWKRKRATKSYIDHKSSSLGIAEPTGGR